VRGIKDTKGQKGQRILSSPHARVKRSKHPLPLLPPAALAAPTSPSRLHKKAAPPDPRQLSLDLVIPGDPSSIPYSGESPW
jgi:hypothetical protein